LSPRVTGDMRRHRAPLAGGLALGLLAALTAAPVRAQVSAIAPQSLFFAQAGIGANRGNYLEADAGAIYTDNVFLEPSGPGATLGLVGLLGDLERTGTRLDYRLNSDITVVKYFPSDFKTQPFGYADGFAEFKILPSFFSWTARDTYSDLVINPLDAVTPDNLETINVVTTGPRFTLTPTLRTTIVLDGFYSFVDSNSNSPQYVNINNHRYGGDLTLKRAFTGRTSAYVTGIVQKVEYSDTLQNTDYRSEAANGGIRVEDPRTLVDLSGGYQRLRTTVVTLVPSDIGIIEQSQNLTPSAANWAANLSRVISPTQRVSLNAQRLIADSSSLFLLGLNQAVPSLNGNLLVNGQPFKYTVYGATWRFEANRTSLQINVSENRQDYEYTTNSGTANNGINGTNNNLTFKFAGALLTRKLSPVLNWDLGVSYGDNEYASSTNHIATILTSLRWNVGQRLGLRFVYAYTNQSNPGGYSNNLVGLVASYTLTPVAGGQSQPPAGESSFLSPVAPGSTQPWQPPVQAPSPPQ
jgi:hypothetical protein